MQHRRVIARATCALLLLLPLPAHAQSADTAEELHDAREQLSGAERDLDATDRSLRTARADLDEVEARLDAASEDLAVIEDDLAVAEDALGEASAVALGAADELAEATAELDRARTALRQRQERLDSRVRDLYVRGGGTPAMLILTGLSNAQTLHDITTTARAARRMALKDAHLVRDSRNVALAEVDARSRVATAHEQARAAEFDAAQQRDRVARLVERQERTVQGISDERARKTAILRDIEADRFAAARLVSQLRARVAELSAELGAVLIPPDSDAVFNGPVPAWASALPARGRPWSPAIVGAAALGGVDARLLAALVWSESSFHAGAVSSAGAIGLTQLLPSTARVLGVDPYDPIQNLVGGAHYLRAQIERFGRADLALAAYNAGPGRVEAAGREVPDLVETQIYVLRVLDRYQLLLAASDA